MSGDALPSADGPSRLRRLKIIALIVILIGVGLDLGTKAWFEGLLGMDPGPESGPFKRIEVIPGFFALEGVYNPGVTFGLAPGKTMPILIFTAIAMIALTAWLFGTRRQSLLLHIGLAMVIGGAIGNLYDRIRWHKVRDFFLFYVGDWKWPNFNVGDSFIVVGVILILWDELFGRREPAKTTASTSAEA